MAKVSPEGMPHVAKVRDFLISNIKWVCGAVLLVVVSASIIVAIVLRLQPKPQGDNPKYTATCVLVDYTMWKPIQTRCKISVPAEIEADISVSKTLFSLNSGESLPVNCSYQDMDRVISCQGPHVTCQIRGVLSIAFFDNDGKPVLDKTQFNLGSPIPPLVTSVVQDFEPVGKNLTSNFNFTCALTSSCDTYTMALFVGGSLHLTEEDALLCINTSMTDDGYNKSCVFKVDEDVIRQQRSMDISCALLQHGVLPKQDMFRLPMCSDRSSDCNCSAEPSSCGSICTQVENCLSQDPVSRYQNITTRDPLLWHICPVLCTPKWCRDIFNDDKTEIDSPGIFKAMCKNS